MPGLGRIRDRRPCGVGAEIGDKPTELYETARDHVLPPMNRLSRASSTAEGRQPDRGRSRASRVRTRYPSRASVTQLLVLSARLHWLCCSKIAVLPKRTRSKKRAPSSIRRRRDACWWHVFGRSLVKDRTSRSRDELLNQRLLYAPFHSRDINPLLARSTDRPGEPLKTNRTDETAGIQVCDRERREQQVPRRSSCH